MEAHTTDSRPLVTTSGKVRGIKPTESGGRIKSHGTRHEDTVHLDRTNNWHSQPASHPADIVCQRLLLDTEDHKNTTLRSTKLETQRQEAARRPRLTKSNTSCSVDDSHRVYIATGTSRIPNIFCDDMFIILPGNSKFTLRRCQYDTASDVNIISYSAWRSLNISAVATFCQVEGLGGEVSLHGSVNFSWRLRSDVTRKLEKTYTDTFYILPPDQKVTFDCIIGRVWIQNHKRVFQRLLE